MKNVKKFLMFIIISTFLFASAQRINSLGGNVGYWTDDDNSWTAFPHTINNSNLAQVSGVGSEGNHNAIVRWGDGIKWGFSWNQANANDMINLQWGNGTFGATAGLSMSANGDEASDTPAAKSGIGVSASVGMEFGFGEIGAGGYYSSYDDGMAATKNDPASIGGWANIRRAQSLLIFENMLVGIKYGTTNTWNDNYGNWANDEMAWGATGTETQTNIDFDVSLYTHISISENTIGLFAMGFGYYSSTGGWNCDNCDTDGTFEAVIGNEDNPNTAFVEPTVDAISGPTYSWSKSKLDNKVALPTWTFAVESAMTDWATCRLGVTAGYNVMTTTNDGIASSKDVTGRGGTDTAFSMGLGFNYGSFDLDVDVNEGLFTNPVQYTFGFESIAPAGATATLTYSW